MKKLLFVDCCIRGDVSRTKKLAEAFLSALPEGYAIERVDLGTAEIYPLDRARYFAREKLLDGGKLGDPLFGYAKQLAEADVVLVASPFWDMGIPARLKTYIENVSIAGITFSCDQAGNYEVQGGAHDLSHDPRHGDPRRERNGTGDALPQSDLQILRHRRA